MLLADGNIYCNKEQNTYYISLPSTDKEHIEKFKLFMNSGHKVLI